MTPVERARQLFTQASTAMEHGAFNEAVGLLSEANGLVPDRQSILTNLAAALIKLERPLEAEKFARQALLQDTNNFEASLNLSQSLSFQGLHEEALNALETVPAGHPGAQMVRANILGKQGRNAEALVLLEKLLTQDPNNVELWINQAAELRALKRPEEALASAKQATLLAPERAESWLNLGNAQHDLHQNEEALVSFSRAIERSPLKANAWLGRSAVLHELQRFEEAACACEEALRLHPEHAGAHANLSQTQFHLRKMKAAYQSMDTAIRLKPGEPLQAGIRLHLKQHCCDWEDFEQEVSDLRDAIETGQAASDPFCFLGVPSSPNMQLRCAMLYAKHRLSYRPKPLWQAQRAQHKRIRIAYFSADFHEHATAWLTARLFELHDRERFEVHAFSFGPDKQDSMRLRLKNAFEHFHEVRDLSDSRIAAMAHALQIDIAIDLKGYTTDSRPGIFSYRPAPLQLNYLGYPGSMGVDFIDYLIADPIVIPKGAESDYSEKIIRLPDSYQVNDPLRKVAPKTPERSTIGLPTDAFVFCCFNNNYKITPDVFAIWMRLLAQVPGSVLWLLGDNPDAMLHLKRSATHAGIKEERLVFAARTSLPEHLARQRQADLFLDTFHYNAHTTASDALWAGLPMITLRGTTFPARVGASLLSAINMPELITDTPLAYEKLALELASNPEKLTRARQKLTEKRGTAPLFDAALFTRHIESAYTEIHARHARGEKPTDLDILP